MTAKKSKRFAITSYISTGYGEPNSLTTLTINGMIEARKGIALTPYGSRG
jgi:hypothetical protein